MTCVFLAAITLCSRATTRFLIL